MLLIAIVGCTSSNVKKVRDGHLNRFGDEVTIGEVFDVVSGNSTSWEEDELDKDYVLVDAKWDGAGGKVLVQFLVKKSEDDFSVNATTLNGQPFEVWDILNEIKSEYNKRVN